MDNIPEKYKLPTFREWFDVNEANVVFPWGSKQGEFGDVHEYPGLDPDDPIFPPRRDRPLNIKRDRRMSTGGGGSGGPGGPGGGTTGRITNRTTNEIYLTSFPGAPVNQIYDQLMANANFTDQLDRIQENSRPARGGQPVRRGSILIHLLLSYVENDSNFLTFVISNFIPDPEDPSSTSRSQILRATREGYENMFRSERKITKSKLSPEYVRLLDDLIYYIGMGNGVENGSAMIKVIMMYIRGGTIGEQSYPSRYDDFIAHVQGVHSIR